MLTGRFDEPGTSADAWRGWYTHPGTSTPSLIGYSFNQNYQVLNTLSLGQWNDFVMHIHWSAHDGQIQMWHRLPGQSWIEVLSVNVPTLRYDPQTNVSDDIGLLKQGLYRQSYCQQPTVLTACNSTIGLQPPDILYEDAFVRGSSFDEVVAAAFDNSGQSAASAPPPPAASSTPPVSQSNTPAAPTGPDLPLVGNLSPATDSGCSGCVGVHLPGARRRGRDDRRRARLARHRVRARRLRRVVRVERARVDARRHRPRSLDSSRRKSLCPPAARCERQPRVGDLRRRIQPADSASGAPPAVSAPRRSTSRRVS